MEYCEEKRLRTYAESQGRMRISISCQLGHSGKYHFGMGCNAEVPSRRGLRSILVIARSLSTGNGYKDLEGPWPTRPDYARMSGWPSIIAHGLWIAPGTPPEAVSRFANVFCLFCAGMFFCILSQILGVRPNFAVLAGLAISLSPWLVYLSVDGASEISFVTIIAVGICAAFAEGRWINVGVFFLGLGPLIRTNLFLAPPCTVERPSRFALV
jgi:hypothetical protein